MVFKYSSIELTESMNTLLNRVNFSILPDKIDVTQLLVDCKKYERALIWTEFWYGKDDETMKEQFLFKKRINKIFLKTTKYQKI